MVEDDDKKTPKVGIMTDHEGNPSSMRWMSVGCILFAVVFGCWTMYQGKEDPGMSLVLIFLVGGFAPKTLQKFAEKMLAKKP